MPSSREASHPTDVDAVVIGAGFAGLYMLHQLRDRLGLRTVVFEAGGGVGGTWYWNRYPGARCDTESYVYCYSFSEELLQDWSWSGKYPTQPELLSYLNHVADRFDLRDDIRLDTRIERATFDDATSTWTVETSAGERVTTRFLITGIGLLASAPYSPTFEGAEDFSGEILHTGAWPQEPVDFTGKRVGVIGTGSTGVQIIPELARLAEHVTVFQRTAQFTVPAQHHTVDDSTLQAIKKDYPAIWEATYKSVGGFPWQHNGRSALEDTAEEREATFRALWDEGGFRFIFGSYKDLLTNRDSNSYVAEFVRDRIRERVQDPRARDLLVPHDEPFAARRPIVDTHYFETYDRENVELVDVSSNPIRRLTPTGIETSELHALDVIVYATGFDAVSGPFLRMDITGSGGLNLRDAWSDGPRTYLGLGTAGFPNLFTVTGPGSAFGNLPVVIQHHVEWISSAIEHLIATGADTMSVSEAAQDAWAEELVETAARTVIPLADSWYSGSNIPGKPRSVSFYMGSYSIYRERCDAIAADDYSGFHVEGSDAATRGLSSGVAGTAARS